MTNSAGRKKLGLTNRPSYDTIIIEKRKDTSQIRKAF